MEYLYLGLITVIVAFIGIIHGWREENIKALFINLAYWGMVQAILLTIVWLLSCCLDEAKYFIQLILAMIIAYLIFISSAVIIWICKNFRPWRKIPVN